MSLPSRLFLVFGTACVMMMTYTGSAQACWLSRVFTSSYYNAGSCCPAPVTPTCCTVRTVPTTSCSTTNVQKCQVIPQTQYVTRSRVVPMTSVVRRSYWDPTCCRYRSYLAPTTQYVRRSYSVPVTTYVQQCSYEPVTTCIQRPDRVYTTAVYDSCGRIVDVRLSSYSQAPGNQEEPVDERKSSYGTDPATEDAGKPKPAGSEADGMPKPQPLGPPSPGESEEKEKTSIRHPNPLQFTSLLKREPTSWRRARSTK